MAKLAVDRVVEREGREAPCRTEEIQLGMPAGPGELPEVEGVDDESAGHLAARYGHAAVDVLEIAASDAELARRLTPDLPDIAAEVAFAARREQARSVGDVLLRRTRLGLLDARRLAAEGAEGAELAARTLGRELGWDETRTKAELEAWREIAAAEGVVPELAEVSA
jgi:glycerol-3-phosphate dehydrogenase